MDDAYFLDSTAFAALVSHGSEFVAFGVGLAICFLMLGIVLVWLYGYLRGGL